ncbi:MAG TPA: tetrahydrodipicolinate N-succinyltransferase N-terminal domain-containing protein [Gaiellaceae bacterium]|jgi:2,3,4,5-tetrahydropyridine-2,6-dicarboxylate N-succinyltransferase
MSKKDFDSLVAEIEGKKGYERPAAFAVGLATVSRFGRVLDTYYPFTNLGDGYPAAAVLSRIAGRIAGGGSFELEPEQLNEAIRLLAAGEADGEPDLNIEALRMALAALPKDEHAFHSQRTRRAVVGFIGDLADQPADVADIYLRLHLLSQRKIQPHGCNLENIFGVLPNVVWSNRGPFDSDEFERTRAELIGQGIELKVRSVDKFPRMTDYVVPSGIRIANADNVRLGAHLAPGTTVMAAGFINFNAGTLGPSMVEGRISAGVVVEPESDVGGGASIMGTLSGGGGQVIRIGSHCLLGANSGCGISLGDGCTIEAGLYVTAGARVTMPDGSVVKARDLSGRSGLLFWRNSQTGAIEVKERGNTVALNTALHQNKN